jgi:hypothetical protein
MAKQLNRLLPGHLLNNEERQQDNPKIKETRLESAASETLDKALTKQGRPRIHPIGERGAERGCKPNETRVTTIMDKGLLEKVRRLAYWDRRKFKDVVTMAVEAQVAAYEKKNGPLEEIPER